MVRFVHALIEEEYLVKGLLGGGSLPQVWHDEEGWSEFPIPLTEIMKAFSIRMLSPSEAVRHMDSSRIGGGAAARSL